MQDNYINILLDLKEAKVKNVEILSDEIYIYIETVAHECKCPCCGKKTAKIHDYRIQKIKDIPYTFKPVIIVLRKRRYACSCGKRFYENYDFLPKYHRMTSRLAACVCNLFTDTISIKKVANLTNLSVTTVTRILDKIHYGKPDISKTIAIDEFKGNAETGKFQCILVDPQKKKILDILPSRTDAFLTQYFREIPKDKRHRVKFFVCDMWKPYVELAKIFFPNAKIIIDKYHFIRQVSWALEGVRKRLQKTMPAKLRRYYKHSRSLLMKSYHSLSEEEKQAVDLMLLYNDDLRFAHRLKEEFWKICHMKKYSEQRKSFNNWILRAQNSNIKEFEKCASTYINWHKEILNAFKYNYSNGCTEGFNNKIKVIKRTSYGVKNFKRFRIRILHATK